MKRMITLVLCLGVLSVSSVAFAKSEITDIGNENGYVNISGRADVSFGNVSYTVVPKGMEESAVNAVSIGEAVTDEAGSFEIAIKADFTKSLWRDGDYTVSLRIGNEDAIKYDFYYYSKEKKDDIISGFLLNPSKDSLAPDSETYKTLCAMGVGFDKIKDTDMEELLSSTKEILSAETTEEELVNILNKGVALVIVNSGRNADLTDVYDEFKEFDKEKQTWIEKALVENGKYDNTTELDYGYEFTKVFYNINYAKHSEFYDYIKDNKDIFVDAYEKLSELSSVKRGKACEEIADELKLHNVYTLEELNDIVEDAAEEAGKSSSSSKNSGGSGGGGGGSTQGFVSVKTPETEKIQPNLPDEIKKLPFDDLGTVSWAAVAIEDLYAKGIVKGVTENNFEPDRPVKREEFITMLVRSAGLTMKDTDMKFDDVKENDWYYEAVKIAYSNGVTSGISENKFGAGEYITRQDMAVMVSRIFDVETAESDIEFKDSNLISDYAKESISKLCGAGIISGMGDGTFSPLGNTTRAQATVVIFRVLGK